MLAKVQSFGLSGIEAYPVEIEVDISNGLPAITLVGLPDSAIRESRERVKSAIKNSGFFWPKERITISLAPSDINKEGACFDLPIALGILAASGQVDAEKLKHYLILGELSLDGSLRQARGILPISIAAAKSNIKNLITPIENASEAAIVSQVSVFALKTLKETVGFLHDQQMVNPFKVDLDNLFKVNAHYKVNFSEIKGQHLAKRALEVAAAGGHNIAMIGPPGSGKTMLAKRIPTIMPDLTLEEALEITKIHSINGTLPAKEGIIATRPFRSPHHTISDIALVGGGSVPRPGEISLAHHGVLFLDELPEFSRRCLETLRQPLEEGLIRISRINKSLIFPASFILIAALNPCPCGNLSDPRKKCSCNPAKIHNYMGKISGPLLDRIDIHIEVPAIRYSELSDTKDSEPSKDIKARVEKARALQRQRLKEEGVFCNAQMDARLIKKYSRFDGEAGELLKLAMLELALSARAYDKILKVSRTIADLAGSGSILAEHISEAIQYRSLDRQWSE